MSDTQVLTEQEADRDDASGRQDHIDFKMVTFSLGGKDYGIDIMRVKEIAKFAQFTYVPNTAPYVRGVYNLRGDIISVIDLRLMFNLPAEQREEGRSENGLILRLENNLIGVVVDNIDKVVGISSSAVQPPHPIFGDINVKYISGVAEHENRLYIILDVDRIFRRDSPEDETSTAMPVEARAQAERPAEERPVRQRTSDDDGVRDEREMHKEFVAQGLATFSGFHVTALNHDWFEHRLEEWRNERKQAGLDVQFTDKSEATAFLEPFFSRYTERFWGSEYAQELLALLPQPQGAVIHVWNPGCGAGYESYSIAAMLHKRFPEHQIKVWGGDKDLMKISTAPNLMFFKEDVPEEWHDLLVEGKNGPAFSTALKESILFEFSDVLNSAGMPKMDMIVARDLASLHSEQEQHKIIETFEETLKPGGALLLGDNERLLDGAAWDEITGDSLTVYRRL